MSDEAAIAATPVPGIWKDFGGGHKYLVPPISFGALELLRERIDAIPNLQPTDPVAQGTVVDMTLAALKRNYPSMTRAYLADFLDVSNMFEAYECVMDIGGMKRKQIADAEAAQRSGNDQAESTTGGGSSPA